jgi:hypothetical protein
LLKIARHRRLTPGILRLTALEVATIADTRSKEGVDGVS